VSPKPSSAFGLPSGCLESKRIAMPFYDYACKKCDCVFEIMHSFKDKPKPACPKCNSTNTQKVVSACGIIIHSTRAKTFVLDAVKQESDKRAALKQMGIENIKPMAGVTLDQVYAEIDKNKTAVREQMCAQKEKDNAARKIKQREWLRKAVKRTPERAKIRKEMQAKEEAAKRAIRL